MRSRVAARAAAVLACLCLAGCDILDEGSPTAPSPGGSATVVIENFTATATAGFPTFTYRVTMRLRETGGASATITGITLTLTQTSGATAATEVSPMEAFGATTLPANGTLDAANVAFTGPPVAASSLAARVTYTGAGGTTGTATSTTTVVTN